MTRGPLCELVPIENAAMPDRTVIQWNKDDLDELGILKVDCLALGMLTAIRKCFRSGAAAPRPRNSTLANIPAEDAGDVYAMIRRADTMGVFQIESRAQMSMLPRLQPRLLLRPGDRGGDRPARADPGQHGPSLSAPPQRRGAGHAIPTRRSRRCWRRRSACRCFRSRRCGWPWWRPASRPARPTSCAARWRAWRRPGVLDQFRTKLIDGMLDARLSRRVRRGASSSRSAASASTAFPKSHAASFALLVYVSAWLKYHYPAAFTARC